MTNKRTVINFEAREFWLIHKAEDEVSSFCEDCNAETDWIKPEQAVVVTGMSAREIFRRVENGTLHFKEIGEGFLLICAHALIHTNEEKKMTANGR